MANHHCSDNRGTLRWIVALEHHPVKTPASMPRTRRNPINRITLGRREILAISAAFVMLLLLFQATQAPDEAVAQSSNNGQDDIGVLVSAGNEVQGSSESSGRAKPSSGPKSLPQTGTEIDKPTLLGLVLLLDGALALFLTSRRQPRVYSPN